MAGSPGRMQGAGDRARGDRSRSSPPRIGAKDPIVRTIPPLRPWNQRGWSQPGSRLGHRHIGRAGDKIGRGGSESGSGDCGVDGCSFVGWAGRRTTLGQRGSLRSRGCGVVATLSIKDRRRRRLRRGTDDVLLARHHLELRHPTLPGRLPPLASNVAVATAGPPNTAPPRRTR